MEVALEQARLAAQAGEVPVGALLLDATGAVLAQGFNQPVSSRDPTAHAEIVVLRSAAKKLSNYRLPGTTLVVTVEPCLMCAGALINARVARVIYGASEPKWGAFASQMRVGELKLNHRMDVIPGVREDACAAILRDFFLARRS